MKYIGCDIESNRSIRYDPKVCMERKTCRDHPSLRDLRSEPKSRSASGVGRAGPLLPAGASTVLYRTVALLVVATVPRGAEQAEQVSETTARVFPPYSIRTKDQTGSEYSYEYSTLLCRGG